MFSDTYIKSTMARRFFCSRRKFRIAFFCFSLLTIVGAFPQESFRDLKLETPRMHGADIQRLQDRLVEFNFLSKADIDGYFGPKTLAAVRKAIYETDAYPPEFVDQGTWDRIFFTHVIIAVYPTYGKAVVDSDISGENFSAWNLRIEGKQFSDHDPLLLSQIPTGHFPDEYQVALRIDKPTREKYKKFSLSIAEISYPAKGERKLLPVLNKEFSTRELGDSLYTTRFDARFRQLVITLRSGDTVLSNDTVSWMAGE